MSLLPSYPPNASALLRGLVSVGAQTFAGNKTLSGSLTLSGGLSTGASVSISGALTSSLALNAPSLWLESTGNNALYLRSANTPAILAQGVPIVSFNAGGGVAPLLNTTYAIYMNGGSSTGIQWGQAIPRITTELADGASSIALLVNTTTTWSNATAKLTSFQTNSAEKSSVLVSGEYSGPLRVSGQAVGTITHNGTSFSFGSRATTAEYWQSTSPAVGFFCNHASGYYGALGTAGLKGSIADGPTAVGAVIDNTVTLTHPLAKAVSYQTGGAEKRILRPNGVDGVMGTDSRATPGNVTINKPSGIFAITSGSTTVLITNNCVNTGSLVFITPLSGSEFHSFVVAPISGAFWCNVEVAVGKNNLSGSWKAGFEVKEMI